MSYTRGWAKNVFRTVIECVCIMIAFSVLYIIASLIIKGHVDWY